MRTASPTSPSSPGIATSTAEELFAIGQEIDVYVMRVDRENKKIALSIRRAAPEQWRDLIAQYQVGDIVPGVVTKLVAFGAFTRLPGPVEGLAHVSEIVDRRINHPEEVLSEGDVIPLKIVRIEHDRHRLGLSLREARSEAEIRGWRFDDQGRAVEFPDEAREAFPEEAAAVDQRYAARRDEAAATSSAREGAAPHSRRPASAASRRLAAADRHGRRHAGSAGPARSHRAGRRRRRSHRRHCRGRRRARRRGLDGRSCRARARSGCSR